MAFAGGIVVAVEPDAPAAQRFVDAWERDDIAAMYDELTPAAQEEYSLPSFRGTYDEAAATATVAELSAGEVTEADEAASVPVSMRTRLFGELGGELTVPLTDGKVAWAPHLVYPDLDAGEQLSRETRAPERAAILAADRSPLAEGPASARIVGTAALAVVGEVGSPSRSQAERLTERGFPSGTLTGTSGLELAFNDRLAGRPGGQLLAVPEGADADTAAGRVLATSQPKRGKAVRTYIDPELQDATVAALGSLYGGAAVLDTRTGAVLALAGLAYSAPQPPGSTFKIITATGALDAGIVKPSDEFPVESSNSEIGREIPNAHDELCGGTFTESFANSCNTVFAPLGAELGGPELVETAELYGWNAPPPLFDRATTALIDPPQSTIPKDLTESVETGESAIGQGQVLATPLRDGDRRGDGRQRRQAPARPDRPRPRAPATARHGQGHLPRDRGDTPRPDDPGRHQRHRGGRGAPRDPGRGEDRDRGARPERARARPGARPRRGAAPGHRRLVHRVRPRGRPEDRGRSDGGGRRRRRRHGRRADRAPDHGLLLRGRVTRIYRGGKPIVAPMITSAEPAIATTPAAVSAGSESSAIGEAGDGERRAQADQQPPSPAAAAALGLDQPGAGDEHAQARDPRPGREQAAHDHDGRRGDHDQHELKLARRHAAAVDRLD